MFVNYKKGEIGHLKIELRALEKGFTVCYPRIESRFDMVLVDPDGKCHRAQVKYTDQSTNNNSVLVDLRKSTRGTGKVKRYSKTEIDVVLVYIPQIDKVLWLVSDLFNEKSTLTFRLSPSKNHQTKGIRVVEDFVW